MEAEAKKKTALPEIEDVIIQHSYPAHNEATFYPMPPQRDHEMDHESVGDQLVQQALANLAEHQEQQNQEHENDLRELRALQDAQLEQPQHHVHQDVHQDRGHTDHEDHHAPVSADELRLAAQLTQEIAPMVAASAASAAAAIAAANAAVNVVQAHSPPDGLPRELPPALEAQDQSHLHPDLQRQLQAELQIHDRELQHAVASVAGINGEQAIKSQYASTDPSLSPHPPAILGEQYPRQPLPDYTNHTNPRKRTKVSRACDECRRKKIKCDAQTETSHQPCSNCRRADVQCMFSRIPQKRGPSKGYIKELADRINSIEGKLGASVAEALEAVARKSVTESLPSPQSATARKRTFSSFTGDGYPKPPPPPPPPPPSIRGPWHTEPIKAPFTAWSGNKNPEEAVTPAVLPDGSIIPPHPAAGMPDTVAESVVSDTLQPAEPGREIDDVVFGCYLRAIHPTFPVLASTRARAQSVLLRCPLSLQDAFCGAFLELTRPFTPHPSGDNGQRVSTDQLLADWESDRRRWPWSSALGLVYFQTLVMMALNCGHHGVAEPSRQSRDAWESGCLGKAVGLGLSMRLHLATPNLGEGPEPDLESDDNVALRAWWALVVFDRWNAISMGKPLFISPDTAVLPPDMRSLIGEGGHCFIQLSETVGCFDLALPGDEWGLQGNRVLNRLTRIILRRTWEEVSPRLPESQYPLVHLTYWHARLLAELIMPQRRIMAVPQACDNIFRLLADNPQLESPLRHHFLSLATLTLTELAKEEVTREEAEILSDRYMQALGIGAIRDKIVEVTQTPTKTLHQLADVASVANSSPTPAHSTTAPASISAPPPVSSPVPAVPLSGKNAGGENTQVAAPGATPAAAYQEATPATPSMPIAARATQDCPVPTDIRSRYVCNFYPLRFLKAGYLAFLDNAEKEVTGSFS